MFLTPEPDGTFKMHWTLLEAISSQAESDDPFVLEVRAPDGMEHTKHVLQALVFVKHNGPCTRTRICRGMGARFSEAVSQTLLGSGLVDVIKKTVPGAKKPSQVYQITTKGLSLCTSTT